MQIRNALFALSTLAILAACSSSPDRRGPPPDQQARSGAQSSGVFVKPVGLLFTAMDKDRNNIVTGDELISGTDDEWSFFDRNPSAATFLEWSEKSLGSSDAFPTFMSFDGDLNGVVTKMEFSDRLRQEFSSMDKNSDGMLTRNEMLVVFEAPRARQGRNGGEQGGRGGRGGGEGGRGGGRPPR